MHSLGNRMFLLMALRPSNTAGENTLTQSGNSILRQVQSPPNERWLGFYLLDNYPIVETMRGGKFSVHPLCRMAYKMRDPVRGWHVSHLCGLKNRRTCLSTISEGRSDKR